MTIFRGLQHHHRSFVKFSSTLSQQGKLLKLPLPSLEETIPKWMASAQPHLSSEEFQKTKNLAVNFLTEAEPLQDYLRQKAEKCDNWFADWWLDMAYLGYRTGLPVFSSPGILMPPQNFANSEKKWLTYAARVVEAALIYKSQLDAGLVPIEKSGDLPMDMIQYTRLFGATRLPGPQKDTQVYSSKSDFITVAHRGNLFSLKVKDGNGNFANASEILFGLEEVLKQSKLDKCSKIGLLTSDSRDNWHKAYQILLQNDAKSLQEIEESLFLLCLDESLESSTDDTLTKTALNSLHGMGSSQNGYNRWFDKALQFIVAKSGEVGISNEHSFAEAVPTMKIADFVMERCNKEISSIPSKTSELCLPSPISFKTSSEQLQPLLDTASSNLDLLASDLDMQVLNFQEFGKEGIKVLKVSPDSFVQMAIQLTFSGMHNCPAATYESAATRIFKEGRTEVIRSCSLEAVNFVKTMQDKNQSILQKQEALYKAIKAHNSYARSASKGYGVDRHLQGLKMAALELSLPVPGLYQDPGYTRSSRMRLSTSQISSKYSAACCYGPLENDGYGTSYSIGSNNLLFSVSALRSDGSTNAKEFAHHLGANLQDMYDLCATKSKL